MNRFLTEKAVKRRGWEIPVVGFLTVLGAVATDDTIKSYWLYRYASSVDRVVVTTLTVLIWMPIFRIIQHHFRKRRARDISERLIAHDGERIPLAALDEALGIRHAERKIDALKERGYLKGIATDGSNLLLDDVPAPPKRESAARSKSKQPPAADDAAPTDVLQRIRWLNDEIDDAAVSAQIDRLEGVTAGILQTVRERPERAADARKFMDYYLPATLKLLESYRLMEDQPFQGDTIQSSRQKIENVLSKMVAAMEVQRNRLFDAEALDVDAEISVLEKMIEADGLKMRQ